MNFSGEDNFLIPRGYAVCFHTSEQYMGANYFQNKMQRDFLANFARKNDNVDALQDTFLP